jgi:hypothetical protein
VKLGQMVKRMVAERLPRDVEPGLGGIGGLTDGELDELNDLLNAEQPCGCKTCACSSVLRDPAKRPGREC